MAERIRTFDEEYDMKCTIPVSLLDSVQKLPRSGISLIVQAAAAYVMEVLSFEVGNEAV
jgi:hypothetical protein